MNLFKLSWRNIVSRPLSALTTVLLVTTGVAIISALAQFVQQADKTMKANMQDIDLVIGAKGSSMEIILANVFHVADPTGNIPLSEAKKIERIPLIKESIRLAYGDYYEKFRILGTSHSYCNHYGLELAKGELWISDFEVTLGSQVATKTGLKIGDEFYGQHGKHGGHVHGNQAYTVVGILKKSGLVGDNLIFTTIPSIWRMHEEPGSPAPDNVEEYEADKEITGMLLSYKGSRGMMLPRIIEENTTVRTAVPAQEFNRLTTNVGYGQTAIKYFVGALMTVSLIAMFISLLSSLRERKYELAILRAQGASGRQLFFLIVSEGLILSIVGYGLGMILSRIGLIILGNSISSEFHYEISGMILTIEEIYLGLVTLGVGLLAASIPAWKAAKTEVSKTLADA